jgi:hypothetical protein
MSWEAHSVENGTWNRVSQNHKAAGLDSTNSITTGKTRTENDNEPSVPLRHMYFKDESCVETRWSWERVVRDDGIDGKRRHDDVGALEFQLMRPAFQLNTTTRQTAKSHGRR